MWSVKCYRFGFDPWGLGLFLLIMLINAALNFFLKRDKEG